MFILRNLYKNKGIVSKRKKIEVNRGIVWRKIKDRFINRPLIVIFLSNLTQ